MSSEKSANCSPPVRFHFAYRSQSLCSELSVGGFCKGPLMGLDVASGFAASRLIIRCKPTLSPDDAFCLQLCGVFSSPCFLSSQVCWAAASGISIRRGLHRSRRHVRRHHRWRDCEGHQRKRYFNMGACMSSWVSFWRLGWGLWKRHRNFDCYDKSGSSLRWQTRFTIYSRILSQAR